MHEGQNLRLDDVRDPRQNVPVLIIGYLQGLLEKLEAYLSASLREACEQLHWALGAPAPSQGFAIYDYVFLRSAGTFQLVGGSKVWRHDLHRFHSVCADV